MGERWARARARALSYGRQLFQKACSGNWGNAGEAATGEPAPDDTGLGQTTKTKHKQQFDTFCIFSLIFYGPGPDLIS